MAYANADPWTIRRTRQAYGLSGSDGGAGLGNRFTDARMTRPAAHGLGCPRGGGLGCSGCGGACMRGGLGQSDAGDIDGSFDSLAAGSSDFLLGNDISDDSDISDLFSPSASPGSYIGPDTATPPTIAAQPFSISSGLFSPSATPGAASGSPLAALQAISSALTGTKYTAASPASTTTSGITTTTLEWVGVAAAAVLLIALVSSAGGGGGGRRRR